MVALALYCSTISGGGAGGGCVCVFSCVISLETFPFRSTELEEYENLRISVEFSILLTVRHTQCICVPMRSDQSLPSCKKSATEP